MITGATAIGDKRGLWTVKEEYFNFSEPQVGFSEIPDVCTFDPVSTFV